MFQFSCPHCKTGLKTGNGSGKVARCPNCLALIEVPKSLGQSAPFPYAEEAAAGFSATTDFVSPPARTSDTPDRERKGAQKTNLLLLGLAITGLACGGFMIVNFMAKSDSSTKAALGLKPRAGPGGRIAQAPPLVRPFQPSFQPPAKARVMAQAPLRQHHWRLGTSRFRHGGRVSSLAASSEKKLLASCGEDGQIRIWDMKTGEAVSRFSAGGEPLRCLALSQDGRWVAAGGQRGMLYLWEVPTGRQVKGWPIGRNGIVSVAFAPDGRTLASLGVDHEICLWEVPSVSQLWSWRGDARGLFFSPDGKMLATFVRNDPPMSYMPGGSLMFLDADTGRQRVNIAQPEDIGVGLAFSPDGRTLAIGGRDGVLRLCDMTTGKKLHSFEGHSTMISRVAFSPDGKTLASFGSGVRLWDLAAGKERWRLPRAGNWVVSIAFSDDSKTLYTAEDDHAIHLWDTATGNEIQTDEGQAAVTAVAVAPDGKTAVTTGKDAILRTWDLATGKPLRRYQGHQMPVQCVVYSADGSLLASAASRLNDPRKSEVRLWDASTGQELRRWDGSTEYVGQIKFLPGDRSLAVVEGRQGRVHIWETATGTQLHQFGGNNWTQYSSFSPDGALLALWDSQAVQLWNVTDRSQVGELRPEISGPSFPSGGQGYRGILISAQALSPGGQYLACAARHEYGAIHVFKVSSGAEVDLPQGHVIAVGTPLWREAVSALAWSHDGKTLASGGGDGQVWLWDLPSARALLRCPGHEGPVRALAFSADDRTLVSGSDDTTALVWDLAGLREAAKKPEVKRRP